MNNPHKIVSWLEIDELSACQSPAVEGAKAVILKSADPAERVAKARQSFGAVVKAIADRDHCARHVAMNKARFERPDLFAAAYDYVIEKGSASQPDEAEAAHQRLMSIARDIAGREGLPIHRAMDQARQRNPALFAAARA